MSSQGKKYKITKIMPYDSWYPYKESLEGKIITHVPCVADITHTDGSVGWDFTCDEDIPYGEYTLKTGEEISFYTVFVEEVK